MSWAGPGPWTQDRKERLRGHTCLCRLALQVLDCGSGFSTLCTPTSFCLLHLPQLFHSAASSTTSPPCLEASIKASGQSPAQHMPLLICPSQDSAPPGSGNKKGGGPCTHWLPAAPHTKGWVTKTFSRMAGVGVRFHPECTGRRKAGKAGLPRAAQTCRGRRAGRVPWEGGGRHQGQGPGKQVGMQQC